MYHIMFARYIYIYIKSYWDIYVYIYIYIYKCLLYLDEKKEAGSIE